MIPYLIYGASQLRYEGLPERAFPAHGDPRVRRARP